MEENFISLTAVDFSEENRIADYRFKTTSSKSGVWLVMTTIGSYEKLMTAVPRKMILTFNDTWHQAWVKPDYQVSNGDKLEPGETTTIKLAVGDIQKGATVTYAFASTLVDRTAAPTLKINGQTCEFIGIKSDVDQFTDVKKLYTYEVPESVFDDMYFIAEITNNNGSGTHVLKHVEVYIVPEG